MDQRKLGISRAGWLVVMLAIVAIALVSQLQAHFAAQPKSIVITIEGEAASSRAWTWFTASADTPGEVQLVAADDPDGFSSKQTVTLAAETTVIDTGNGRLQASHKAKTDALNPGTSYMYRVGSGHRRQWSEPYSFTVDPVDMDSYTFIYVTDSQGESEEDFKLWKQTMDAAFERFPTARFVVHAGDLIENPEDEQQWDYFFKYAQQWLARVPFFPVTGNHEEINQVADRFLAHFYLPKNGAKEANPGTNYSFRYGPVHFSIMNTESYVGKQAKWLRSELAKSHASWHIVAMHRGAYGGNRSKKVKEWVEVLDDAAVDLVLQGHNHEYVRSYPLRKNAISSDHPDDVIKGEGTVYVVANSAGAKFNKKKDDQFYHRVHFQNKKPMFAAITVSAEQMRYEAYDYEGVKLDEFTITQQKGE